MTKTYLGKGTAAAAFYAVDGGDLTQAEWLRSELPVDLDQGAEIAVQVQMALTFDALDSGDLAIDEAGALWQSIETSKSGSGAQADLRQCRLARIALGAKVVQEGGFDDLLLEDGDDLLLEDGDNIYLEDSGFHIVAAAVTGIVAGDTIRAAPLDGATDRHESYFIETVLAQTSIGTATAYVLVGDAV